MATIIYKQFETHKTDIKAFRYVSSHSSFPFVSHFELESGSFSSLFLSMSINPSMKFIHFRWLPGIDFRKLMENRIKNIINDTCSENNNGFCLVCLDFCFRSSASHIAIAVAALSQPPNKA